MKDILLYVNVPFCPSKCHFCFYVKHISVGDLRLEPEDALRRSYVAALVEQIRHVGPTLTERGYRPRIMYWGGGTSSSLTLDEFSKVIAALREVFRLDDLEEATMESSPDTLTAEKLAAYREAGFDRISMGVQSFDDDLLAAQGRAHRRADALRAVPMAAEAGFRQINIDLMCGLPGETLASFERTARTTLDLPVTHVSLYPTALVPGTALYRQVARGKGALDNQERLAAYKLGQALFEAAGLPEYSLCYFGAVPCRADCAYYQLEMDWAGFGSGASSLLDGDFLNGHRDLGRFTAQPLSYANRVPAASVAQRFVHYGLIMPEGLVAQRWQERLHEPFRSVLARREVAAQLTRLGGDHLIWDERGVRLPRQGLADILIPNAMPA